MKYFLDTEFIEAKNHLDLISIGIVCDSGETLYCENSEVDWSKASQWVLDNVKPHLQFQDGDGTKSSIDALLARYVSGEAIAKAMLDRLSVNQPVNRENETGLEIGEKLK